MFLISNAPSPCGPREKGVNNVAQYNGLLNKVISFIVALFRGKPRPPSKGPTVEAITAGGNVTIINVTNVIEGPSRERP